MKKLLFLTLAIFVMATTQANAVNIDDIPDDWEEDFIGEGFDDAWFYRINGFHDQGRDFPNFYRFGLYAVVPDRNAIRKRFLYANLFVNPIERYERQRDGSFLRSDTVWQCSLNFKNRGENLVEECLTKVEEDARVYFIKWTIKGTRVSNDTALEMVMDAFENLSN